jgi:hypothetical protein
LIGGKTQPVTTTHGAIGTGWLIKTNAKGEEEWNRTFGTLGSADGLGSLIQASDGGYTLVGTIGADDPATEGDAWLIKTDSEGNMLWNKTYGGMPDCNGQASSDSGHRLVQASDGGYTILGETTFPVPSSSFGEVRDWLIKTDGAGNAPKLSDVYPPVTNLPPIPRQSPTSSEQPQLPMNILLGVIIAGVVGASVLTVLPFKMRKRSKIESTLSGITWVALP